MSSKRTQTAGSRFSSSAPEIAAGIALLLFIGYAFSWVLPSWAS